MPGTATSPSLTDGSFASLLAALASPAAREVQAWNDDGLQDDTATISYEQALRSDMRIREADAADGAVIRSRAADTASSANRKAASLTIRFSAADRALVQLRAAEAGLNVSAYLRSCIFEVENLRAQVKEALSELRSVRTTETPKPVCEPARPAAMAGSPSERSWRSRLFSRWMGTRAPDA